MRRYGDTKRFHVKTGAVQTKTRKPTAAYLLSAPVDEPFVLSDADGRLYRKELIYEGTFRCPGGMTIRADRGLLDHWASVGAELIQAGFNPPVPLEHTGAKNPEANRGEVRRFETGTDSKGRYALFGYVKFSDAEAEKLAARTNVSIYSPLSFEYAGRPYRHPITHVALTNYPVVSGLDGFQTIAASYAGEIKMAIDLAPIAEALELPDGVELTEDNLVALVVTALKNAKGEKPAEKPPEEKPPVGDKPAEKPPMAASNNPMLQSLVRDNRRMKLDQLAREGRLTKPARDLIEKEYMTDQAISLSLNGTDDGFDKAMAIIAANPPCVPVKGEKTGVQATSTVALSHNADTGRGKSSLVADAERRAEQAKNRRR